MQYKKSSLHSIFSITKYVDSLKSRLFAGTTLTSAALPLPLTIASIKATERLFHTLTSSTHTLVGQWSANSPEPWSASTPGCTVRARSFLLHSSIPHSWRKLSAGQLRRQHRSSPASVECAPLHSPRLHRRKASNKYQPRDLLQNTQSALLETVEVTANKESVRHCDSQAKAKEA
ncbi:uncharacterized protein LOC112581204 isoform X2 [Bubalus bubalis]|uniref:uncharacterized protein LOC112581204 isoform X2 n=1 Tax=Bubalus bubalis TaxID=89462 RepID=UPI000DBC8020|nr:uncharacterized protein LOC112581204 isoform X2 [Bubalus bubalis]